MWPAGRADKTKARLVVSICNCRPAAGLLAKSCLCARAFALSSSPAPSSAGVISGAATRKKCLAVRLDTLAGGAPPTHLTGWPASRQPERAQTRQPSTSAKSKPRAANCVISG